MSVNDRPAKRPDASRVTLTQLMGPGSANTLGNVHGGYIMKLCDEAGGMAASKFARRPSVTVAVDSMTFHSPVQIGDLLTVTATVTWSGRTSMETRVVVSAENVISGDVTHTNTAYFVYVALDRNGRPSSVPAVTCETDEEQARFARAAERQARRLAQREQSL
ncbi:MAG: acyl-CoA thioesterase [Candidatus Promineifilaceae bacterium]|nr:acyl-CoA thioesterase [Candidatus Promineifilaceae bacterium]